jgi:hypothetical protein
MRVAALFTAEGGHALMLASFVIRRTGSLDSLACDQNPLPYHDREKQEKHKI